MDQLKFNELNQCINAFEVMANINTLLLAYRAIKSKPGNMTQGVDSETLDGIDLKWFEQTSKSLLNESYSPRPVRRVQIPKPNGKTRPLGIGSPRDKIVQQALKLVIEPILEKIFQDSSHGFRPKRGCHTALKTIRN